MFLGYLKGLPGVDLNFNMHLVFVSTFVCFCVYVGLVFCGHLIFTFLRLKRAIISSVNRPAAAVYKETMKAGDIHTGPTV